ncbi:MAG: hypothetical protein IPL46_10200 [Saprospiraceae bacterium]|nr:hypothetical protein [Saprospiraceae bacterium]
MSNRNLQLYRFWFILPIIGFLSVVGKEAWPLITIVSLPLIIARYLPIRLWSFSGGDRQNNYLNIPLEVRLMPLLIVGLTIFALNTFPKKLDVKNCNVELVSNFVTEMANPASVVPLKAFCASQLSRLDQ